MSQLALDVHGTKLLIGDGATPEVFAQITHIRSIEGPGGASAIIDVSDFDSTHREKMVGVPDEGQLTMALMWLPADAQHAALRTSRLTRTLRNFKLIFSDGTSWCFGAWVTGIELSGKVDDVIRADIELEITGGIFDCGAVFDDDTGELSDTAYEIHLFVPGAIPSNTTLLSLKLPRMVWFPAGLAGSRGGSESAAASSFKASIRRNGSEFAIGMIGAGKTEMSFTGSPVIFNAGDELTVIALNAIQNLDITLVGVR